MRSMRAFLIAGTVVATLVIVALAGTVVYRGTRAALVRQVDRTLVGEAQLLASGVKSSAQGVDLEFSELDMQDFAADTASVYLQLWLDDGTVLYKSPSLAGRDLQRFGDQADRPALQWMRLGDGPPVRAVSMGFRSTVEGDEDGVSGGTTEPAGAAESIGGRLVLARQTADVDRVLAHLRVLLAFVGVLSGGFAAGSLAVVIRRGLRPLDDLARRIAGLRDEDLTARVDLPTTPREIVPVVGQLNDLLGRLEAAFQRERTLGANVAHELRTPLAGLRSTIEVALSQRRGSEDYERALEESLEIVARTQAMVETILYLGRLDAGEVETERQTVDLRELVEASWQPLAEPARARGVSVAWSLPVPLPVATDPMLLEVAIRNLLENAVSYVDDRGRIGVGGFEQGGRGVVCIANSGSKVAQEQVGDLLHRFTRADPSRTASGEHVGLGLALVDRIATVLGCTLDVRSRIDGDFEVVLSVPGTEAAAPRRKRKRSAS